MASELETNIRTALERLVKTLNDASDMTVTTSYKVVDADNPILLRPEEAIEGVLAARTKINLDGDHDALIPVTATATGGIVVEDSLLDFHMQNVRSAIDYRANVISTLANTLGNISRRRTQ